MALKRGNQDMKETIEKDLSSRTFSSKVDSELQVFSIRLPKNKKQILKQHFKSKGIDLSSGVRMILYEYMEKNDLI